MKRCPKTAWAGMQGAFPAMEGVSQDQAFPQDGSTTGTFPHGTCIPRPPHGCQPDFSWPDTQTSHGALTGIALDRICDIARQPASISATTPTAITGRNCRAGLSGSASLDLFRLTTILQDRNGAGKFRRLLRADTNPQVCDLCWHQAVPVARSARNPRRMHDC